MIRIIVAVVLAAHLMWPFAAFAQDKAKGPLDYSLKEYGLMLGFALLGGFVSWWSRVRRGEIPVYSVHHLIGELFTSAFAGLLCFYICESIHLPGLLTIAFTGVAGHMGTRAITMFEGYMSRRFGTSLPAQPDVSLTPSEEDDGEAPKFARRR